jgi:hypothetical protein
MTEGPLYGRWAPAYRQRGFWPQPIFRRLVQIGEISAAMNAGGLP